MDVVNQLLEPRTWILVGLSLDLVGALVVLWGVARLSDTAIQRHEKELLVSTVTIGTEEAEQLRRERRTARIGAGFLALGFLLQLLGQARSS